MSLQEFEKWLKLNYNAEATITNYLGHLIRYFNFSNGVFDQENVDNYLLKQKEENVSKNTFCSILTALKVYNNAGFVEFSKYLVKEF